MDGENQEHVISAAGMGTKIAELEKAVGNLDVEGQREFSEADSSKYKKISKWEKLACICCLIMAYHG